MTKNQSLQGLGLAQNVPGPLLNFAADVVLAGSVLGTILHAVALDLGQVAHCMAGSDCIENPFEHVYFDSIS